jgi:hypothetical protein
MKMYQIITAVTITKVINKGIATSNIRWFIKEEDKSFALILPASIASFISSRKRVGVKPKNRK